MLPGELVEVACGRLRFGELQRRARSLKPQRRARPRRNAHLPNLCRRLETGVTELLARPYRQLHAILEDLFTREVLATSFTMIAGDGCCGTGRLPTGLSCVLTALSDHASIPTAQSAHMLK